MPWKPPGHPKPHRAFHAAPPGRPRSSASAPTPIDCQLLKSDSAKWGRLHSLQATVSLVLQTLVGGVLQRVKLYGTEERNATKNGPDRGHAPPRRNGRRGAFACVCAACLSCKKPTPRGASACVCARLPQRAKAHAARRIRVRLRALASRAKAQAARRGRLRLRGSSTAGLGYFHLLCTHSQSAGLALISLSSRRA